MSDQKISELTAITGANTADDDLLVIVDTSTGETKKITLAELEAGIARGDMTFGDNEKAIFGAGSDLQIYHDGSNSRIVDTGTGDLSLEGANVRFRSTNGDYYAYFTSNAESTLYYNNAAKLATTSTGIDVTGTATMDGLTVDGATTTEINGTDYTYSGTNYEVHTLIGSTGGGVRLGQDSVTHDSFVGTTGTYDLDIVTYNGSSWGKRAKFLNNGDIHFYEDTGTTAKFFWDASAESLALGHSTPSSTYALDVSGKGMRISATAPSIEFQETDTSNQRWSMLGLAGDFTIRDITGGTYPLHIEASAPNNSIRVDSSGNVGIGTSSPSTDLHILSSDNTSYVTVNHPISGTFPQKSGISFGSAATSFDGMTGGAGIQALNTAEAGNVTDLRFWTNATGTPVERMRITSSGNVGIGTSSPSAALDVIGNIESSGSATIGGGVYTSNGSAGFPVHTFSGDNDTGMYQAGANQLGFTTGGTERMRINTSGNVGIGTSSPSYPLHVYDDTGGEVDLAYYQVTNGGDNAYLKLGVNNTANEAIYTSSGTSGGAHVFRITASTEAMRLDASGNLLVGKTNTTFGTAGLSLKGNGEVHATRAGVPVSINRLSTDGNIINFYKDGSNVGSISVTSSATAYNTSSDYRLKEDWQPVANASDRVAQLKPVNFAWKADGTRVDGFLAHELAEVVPEAVTGEKDAVDAEGNPDYQGIDQSKLVPLLTAALQEALARIDTLEAEVTALKGA